MRGNSCVRMWEFRAAWGHPEDKMASSEQTSVTWIWDVPQTVISWKLGLQGSGEAGMETLRADDWSWRGINGFLWKVSQAHMVTAGSWLFFLNGLEGINSYHGYSREISVSFTGCLFFHLFLSDSLCTLPTALKCVPDTPCYPTMLGRY